MQTKHPDGDNLLDFDEALDMLKASLSLENNPKYIPPVETEPTFGTYPYWCLSQAARILWTKVNEWETNLQKFHFVTNDEWPFVIAMLNGMSQYELQMFAENMPDGSIKWQA